ncbi:MAG: DNA internalization-related competence protein ComEC/Rec2 [Firmicutes bacterium]|nr:DNA internalization-related competence protein ComEC/Rec2 [Bacillota bacterium]
MHRPLVVTAGGFIVGILLASRPVFWICFFLLTLGVIAGLLWKQRPQTFLLVLVAAICGAVWLQLRSPVWPGPYGPSLAELQVISVDPGPQSTQLTVRVLSLAGQPIPPWNPVKARLTLTAPLQIVPGDKLAGEFMWQAPSHPLNPGEFNYAAYLRRQGILATAFVNDSTSLQHTPATSPSWPLRSQLLTRAAKLNGPGGELLRTLTLGNSPGDWAESWRQTGLAHVLSISGLHIGLVSVALLGGLRHCRVPTNGAYLFVALCLLLYGYILGPRPAVWRAIIMALMGMLAVANNRVRDWPSAVSLAAILLLIYNPHYLWDAGWQLSFAATIGLLLFSPLIRSFLPPLPGKLDWTVSASLAAQLATLPLVLHHFYLVTPLALVFNVILTPLLPVALITGLAYLLLPIVGDLLLPVLDFLYSAMIGLVDWFATWPLASFSPGAPPPALLLIYSLLLPAVFCWRPRWRPFLATVLVMVCVLLFVWQPLVRFATNTYNLCVLSVGQGAAGVLHLPGGKAVLFDVGCEHEAGGRQIIVPYLRYRGTWQIQSVYLSHLHDDHIVGLADVIAAFPVGSLYLPATSLYSPAFNRLVPLLEQYGIPVYAWTVGDSQSHAGVQVTALNPPPGPGQDENEDSLVLLLQWPNLRALAPGDIGQREVELLPLLPREVDVLLVPHHGSGHSSNEEFLRLLSPRHAIISVGAPNRYGHPAPATLERLARYSQQIWRTDRHGAITILNNPHGYRISPFLSP